MYIRCVNQWSPTSSYHARLVAGDAPKVSRRYMQLYDLLTGEEFRVGVGGEAALALAPAGGRRAVAV